mmetsp:Transcript_36504/g.32749  ORF Transcript_36504/g.32749 Transcript_36504/m.32749 type:complete len:113 (+) Transcript_36504:656-994(+)|eukprot:CAMPEP_0114587962 /NCGR_PEP_ID=MMETSP0125-20121206/10789_1 /TAXON_ID=485358 ORGANISM="Aristerostoma sp., Strain ATCC 50986" /NCGR_SAMPLE_ID=MMETSP0125 /ASSEMBLY_ACC=CAM_ASM_000245 /LENGTH=112 /DNA_ID=CAMNT_0001784131 /DNA_START=650 /DNA_END=988 /DNA_ORIENTATION=-
MQKRVLNKEDEAHRNIPTSSNYYPITSRIYIEDQGKSQEATRRMTLMTDRPYGGSSLNEGEIEIMLHRVTKDDDQKGVGERLYELEDDEWTAVTVDNHLKLFFQEPYVDSDR